MVGRAIIVICPHRPQNLGSPVLGHVAWGFEYEDGTWNIGGSEGPNWPPAPGPLNNGFWMYRLPTLDAALMYFSYNMRVKFETDYDYFKLLRVNGDIQPHPQQAENVGRWIGNQSYSLVGRNCMNDVYDVLKAYAADYAYYEGTELPNPGLNWIPNGWFNAVYTPPNQYFRLPAPPSQELLTHTAPINIAEGSIPSAPSWRRRVARTTCRCRHSPLRQRQNKRPSRPRSTGTASSRQSALFECTHDRHLHR